MVWLRLSQQASKHCPTTLTLAFYTWTSHKYRTTYFQEECPRWNHTLICHKFHEPTEKNVHKIGFFNRTTHKFECFLFQINTSYTRFPVPFALFSSPCSTKAPLRSYQRRWKSSKTTLNQAQFQLALSQLPPRFTTEELCNGFVNSFDHVDYSSVIRIGFAEGSWWWSYWWGSDAIVRKWRFAYSSALSFHYVGYEMTS